MSCKPPPDEKITTQPNPTPATTPRRRYRDPLHISNPTQIHNPDFRVPSNLHHALFPAHTPRQLPLPLLLLRGPLFHKHPSHRSSVRCGGGVCKPNSRMLGLVFGGQGGCAEFWGEGRRTGGAREDWRDRRERGKRGGEEDIDGSYWVKILDKWSMGI